MLSNKYNTLKSRIKLSSVINRYTPLKPTHNNEFIGLCPFHAEKTPSFTVKDEEEFYHCFGCGEHGDVFNFLKKSMNMDFEDAFVYLGGISSQILRETNIVKTANEDKVKISPIMPIPHEVDYPYDIIKRRPGNPTIHEYRDINNERCFIIVRYDRIGEKKAMNPMYYGSDGNWYNKLPSRMLYNLPSLAKESEKVIIVEGEKCCDKLSSIIKDVPVLTWSGGTASIAKAEWQVLRGKKIIFWPDNDKPGRDAAIELQGILKNVTILEPPGWAMKSWDVCDAITIDKWGEKEIREFIFDNSDIIEEIRNKEVQERYKFPDELLDAPNLIGDIMRYILTTSMKPYPVLALAASISAVGAIMAHRFKTETDLRTNMYVIGIAESGVGKDHARKCIIHLFNECGIHNYLSENFKSKSSIYSALNVTKGIKLAMLDELGQTLKSLNSRNASNFQRDITSMYIRLFSSASTLFFGEEAADPEKNPRQDIDQPCLCLYGTTVKSHLVEAMTSTEAIDGFLSRWLIFEPELVFQKKLKNVSSLYNVPRELLTKIKNIIKQPTNTEPQGNVDIYNKIRPKTVIFDSKATKLRDEFETEVVTRLQNGTSIIRALWNRAEEHADKLALCASDGKVITGDVMEWAIKIIKYCISNMYGMVVNHIADNEYEKNLKRVLAILRDTPGGMSADIIYRKTRWLNQRQRKEILDHLVNEGTVTTIEQRLGVAGKRKSVIYRITMEQ